MKTKTYKTYKIIDHGDGWGPILLPTGPWSDDFIKVIKRKNITGLRFSFSFGWRDVDMSFLAGLKDLGLRKIDIYHWDVKDVSPLGFLPELESISLQTLLTTAPDFTQFKNLTHFFTNWRTKTASALNCSALEYLNIVNYPREDLENLRHMKALKSLYLSSRKLTSLKGVEDLSALEKLDLYACTQLRSLNGIEGCQRLQSVDVHSCNKLGDLSQFGSLVKVGL